MMGTEPSSGAKATVARRGWLAVAEHLARSYRRSWQASVASGFVSPLLYLGALGFGLGSLVNAGRGIDGITYAAFVAPGVLAATTMDIAGAELTFPVVGATTWNRRYHAMIVSPLGVTDIIWGQLAFVAGRMLLTSVLFVIAVGLLGVWSSAWVLAAIPVAVLSGIAIGTPIFGYAAYSSRHGGGNPMNILLRFVLAPMMLFCGTYFPVAALPDWLRYLVFGTPLFHGIEACRAITTGALSAPGGWARLAGHVGVLVAYAVAGYLVTTRTLASRLDESA